MSIPAVSRSPVNRASSRRSSDESTRRSLTRSRPPVTRSTYSSVPETFFQRTPPRVECAPHPKASHSPSLQDLKIYEEVFPRLATFQISIYSRPPRPPRQTSSKNLKYSNE